MNILTLTFLWKWFQKYCPRNSHKENKTTGQFCQFVIKHGNKIDMSKHFVTFFVLFWTLLELFKSGYLICSLVSLFHIIQRYKQSDATEEKRDSTETIGHFFFHFPKLRHQTYNTLLGFLERKKNEKYEFLLTNIAFSHKTAFT